MSRSTTPTITPRHDLSAIEIDRLEDRIYEYNCRSTGQRDGKQLGFLAVDERGMQVGAIAGYTWAGVAEIKQLWVDEDHRGKGLGQGLLGAAVNEAIARDCHTVWALSYDFQAPRFYEKHGFERVAELKDWPPGHAHIVLRRLLKSNS